MGVAHLQGAPSHAKRGTLLKDACAYLGQGGKASFQDTSVYMYVYSSTGSDCGLPTLPEEQCLVYLSPSDTTQIWGSGGLPTENLS